MLVFMTGENSSWSRAALLAAMLHCWHMVCWHAQSRVSPYMLLQAHVNKRCELQHVCCCRPMFMNTVSNSWWRAVLLATMPQFWPMARQALARPTQWGPAGMQLQRKKSSMVSRHVSSGDRSQLVIYQHWLQTVLSTSCMALACCMT